MRLVVRWGVGLACLSVVGAAAAQEARGPILHGPVMQGPVAQRPSAQGPSAQGPSAQEPSAQGPTTQGAQEREPASSAEEPKRHRPEAVQLTLQGSLIDYRKTTVTLDKPASSSEQPPDQDTSSTGYGILGSGLGLGIGYAWGQTLLGVRADLTSISTSAPGSDSSATQLSLLPRLEYMFSLDRTRPFIAGIVGIQHSAGSTSLTSSSISPNGSTVTDLTSMVDDSSTSAAIGGAFGVHAFVSRSVSLDPELTVLYTSGSGTLTGSSQTQSNSASNTSSSSQDYSVSSLRILFSLGLSGWIDTGGEPTRPPPYVPPVPVVAAVPAESESQPVSVDIHLPNHRRLYLQVPKDPSVPSVLMRLTEPRDDTVVL